MITFVDRRQLRDGIRNCNLDYNFAKLASSLQSVGGPAGPAGADGVDGVDGTDGTDGPAGDSGAVGPEGEQGIQGIPGAVGGGVDPNLDGGRATSIYVASQSIIGGSA
jgi:hypothetical protein